MGIGTTNPSQALDVSGNVRGTTAYFDTFAGKSDTDTNIKMTGSNIMRFLVGNNETARFDAGRRLIIGRSAYQSAGDPHSPNKLVYVENEGSAGYQILVGITNRNDSQGPTIVLGKTRGTAVGSNTIVQQGDSLGAIRWVGADGNDRQPKAAEIQVAVDGTPGTNDMPGRITFRTSSDGSETPSDRMVIKSDGKVGIGTGAPSGNLHLQGTSFTTLRIEAASNDPTVALKTTAGEWTIRNDVSNSDLLTYRYDNNFRFGCSTGGNFGIGTSSPDAKFEVNNGTLGTSDGNIKNHFSFYSATTNPDYIKLDHIRDGAGTSWTTAKQKLYRKVDSTVMGFIQFGSHGAGGDLVTIGEGNTEYMRVDGSGKVSIGQTTSQAKLSVRMTAAFDSTNAVSTAAIFARNAGTAGSGNLGGAITLSKINSTGPGGSIVAVQTSSDADHMGLAFFTHASSTTNDTVAEKMRLKHDGTLGLGTTSPGALMHLRKVNAEANLDLEDSEGFRMRHFTRYDSSSERYWGLYNHTDARTVLRYKRTTSGSSGDVMCMLENGGSVVIGKNGQFDSSSEAALQIAGAADDLGAAISMMRKDAAINSGTNMARIKVFSDEGSPTLSADVQFAASQAHTSTARGSRIKFHVTANNTTTPAERIRIDQQGQTTFHSTGIAALFKTSGTQTTGSAIQINTGATDITASGTTVFKVFRDGDVANTNNTYAGLSDSKLKENVADASSQWEDLKAVQVRNYNYKADTGYGTHTQIGVVAQEIETVSPGLVTDVPDVDDDGNDLGTTTKSVKYSVLYMKAIKALQEAMDRIETLEAKVAALEAE